MVKKMKKLAGVKSEIAVLKMNLIVVLIVI